MLDPISLSSAFATIIGLVCNFKQEKKDEKDLSNKDFLDWLEQHQLPEIRNYILSNQTVAKNLEILMRENHDVFNSKVNKIDDILASLVSHIEGFRGIVNAIKPTTEISDQAISILRQLVKSNSMEFGQIKNMRLGDTLQLIRGGTIEYNEPRFLDDDLHTLIKFDLLQLRTTEKGNNFYGVTRNAVKLIEAIEKQ